MRTLRNVAVLTLLMAVGTWLLGWWIVPLIAAVVALWSRSASAAVLQSVLAAVLAWGMLLVTQTLFGASLVQFNAALAVSLGVAVPLPLLLSLLLPALLAGSAAATVALLMQIRARPPIAS